MADGMRRWDEQLLAHNQVHVLLILSFCRLGGDGGWTDSNLTGCIHLYYHKKVVEMGFQAKPVGLGVMT